MLPNEEQELRQHNAGKIIKLVVLLLSLKIHATHSNASTDGSKIHVIHVIHTPPYFFQLLSLLLIMPDIHYKASFQVEDHHKPNQEIT